MPHVGGASHPEPGAEALGASWRYTVGNKGVNRVTVYERPDGTCIAIEWWDNEGRHRERLKDDIGHPVTDRELAKKIAQRAAAAQDRKRNQQAAELLGLPSDRSLKELLNRRHADLAKKWTDKYRKSRDRLRTFWLDKLGDVRLTAVSPALVERIALEAQAEGKAKSDRWRQDVLRYLVDSFIYAEKKLKWIEPRHNLSAVEVPTAKGRSEAYTLAEARKLLRALWKVHPVAGWCGQVCAHAGRRIGAVRRLRPSDVRTEGRWTFVTFPGETDKARNTGTAALYDLPARTDWSEPSEDVCGDWLRDAETRAKLPHVAGRGFHGLKRLYATLTTGMAGADLQSGTLRETLEKHYRQDTVDQKTAVAKHVARRLSSGQAHEGDPVGTQREPVPRRRKRVSSVGGRQG